LDRPSVAVLPFTNLSSDPEQQYFSDGITEDIITELSRYRSLFIIARNSSFQFRGTSVDVAAVRRALGIRYIVEGGVRKAGGRIRVTAQLIDAATQAHIWADRYDRQAQDIFTIQDEVTRAVASTLEGRIAASGAEQARRKPTNDWVAYDYFLQGREHMYRYQAAEAEPFFARAIELDSGYVLKRYDEAIVAFRSVRTQPFWVMGMLAASYAQAGQLDNAYRELRSFLAVRPGATLSSVADKIIYADQRLRDHWLEGLRKAGLPE
jgi:TolB-like protein